MDDGLCPQRGVLDTSVIVDLDALDPSQLQSEVAMSALTMLSLPPVLMQQATLVSAPSVRIACSEPRPPSTRCPSTAKQPGAGGCW